jgi:hypothetical protein
MPETTIRALRGTRKRWMPLFLALCCLLSIAHVAAAHDSDFSRNTAHASGQDARTTIPDSRFAIGDFDGDRQADLATVEIARFNSLHSRYSISFQLSKGRPQTIGITAPAGGLVLLARDVNGDRALDVVLVTAWRHEMVAVLLNDGEGHFSAADPAQFQIDSVSFKTQIGIVPQLLEDRTVLCFQYSALRDPGHKIAVARESEPTFSRSRGFPLTLFPPSFSSRAPPRSFLQV